VQDIKLALEVRARKHQVRTWTVVSSLHDSMSGLGRVMEWKDVVARLDDPALGYCDSEKHRTLDALKELPPFDWAKWLEGTNEQVQRRLHLLVYSGVQLRLCLHFVVHHCCTTPLDCRGLLHYTSRYLG
jgi:hypothetical protein